MGHACAQIVHSAAANATGLALQVRTALIIGYAQCITLDPKRRNELGVAYHTASGGFGLGEGISVHKVADLTSDSGVEGDRGGAGGWRCWRSVSGRCTALALAHLRTCAVALADSCCT